MPLDEHMYAEASLAMSRQQMDVAKELYARCAPDYRRTAEHMKQCEAYEQLLLSGVVQRAETRPIREHLAKLFHEPPHSIAISRYAEWLCRGGYDADTLDRLNLNTVDAAAECARMKEGHRACMIQYAETKMPAFERGLVRVAHAFEKCTGIASCMKVAMGSE